jgi:hypothetical protein
MKKQYLVIHQNSKAEQYSILEYSKRGPVRRAWADVAQACPECLTEKDFCPWGASLWTEGENGNMQCIASQYDSSD